MTCGRCAGSITEEITALEGVTEVHIDLVGGGTSTVTVITERPLSVAAVRAAAERPVTRRPLPDHAGASSRTRSVPNRKDTL